MYNNTNLIKNLIKIEKMNQLAPELAKAFRVFAEAAMVTASAAGWIYLAMTRLMLRRLA